MKPFLLFAFAVGLGGFSGVYAQECAVASTYFQSVDALSAPADDTNMNRAEGLAFLIKAAQLAVPEAPSGAFYFRDVDKNSWLLPYAEVAAGLNIITSNGQNFRPSGTMDRATFAVLLMRTYGLDAKSFSPVFKPADVESGAWFAPSLGLLTQLDVMPLDRGNALPERAVTRCQAAAWTFRLLERGQGFAPLKLEEGFNGAFWTATEDPNAAHVAAVARWLRALQATEGDALNPSFAVAEDALVHLGRGNIKAQKAAWLAAENLPQEWREAIQKEAHDNAEALRARAL